MPNLQDVAKQAGVSTATVSKVLSNTPYFTEETRSRVMMAVKELGYMPNLAARALSTGKTHIVAVVFPYLYDAIFKDPLVMQILEGIELECTAEKYNILLSTPRINGDGLDPHYYQLIHSGYIDGLIAIDNVPHASVAEPAIAREIPTIVIGYADSPYYVRSDDFDGGQKLMRHIIALGHSHIGMISVPEDSNDAITRRLMGMQAVAEEAGVTFVNMPILYGDYSIDSGKTATRKLLQAHKQLTAIICLNDRMAFGAINEAQKHGRQVPDDLSVVGYDNLSTSAMITPSLTTIDQHALTLGKHAAQMLFDVLRGENPDPVVLQTDLIVRQSSASPTH